MVYIVLIALIFIINPAKANESGVFTIPDKKPEIVEISYDKPDKKYELQKWLIKNTKTLQKTADKIVPTNRKNVNQARVNLEVNYLGEISDYKITIEKGYKGFNNTVKTIVSNIKFSKMPFKLNRNIIFSFLFERKGNKITVTSLDIIDPKAIEDYKYEEKEEIKIEEKNNLEKEIEAHPIRNYFKSPTPHNSSYVDLRPYRGHYKN